MNFHRRRGVLLCGIVFASLFSISSPTLLTSPSPHLNVEEKEGRKELLKDSLDLLKPESEEVLFKGQTTSSPQYDEPRPTIVPAESGPSSSNSDVRMKQLPSCNKRPKESRPSYQVDGEKSSAEFDYVSVENATPLPPLSTGQQLAIPSSSSNIPADRHFLVTTLDGRLTLLNKGGDEVWSVSTGELFSSTVSSLPLSENGQWVNLIPSLTGGLYKYTGETLVRMPIDVDSLLHKSFKFSNDVVINGGKELKTIGIDLRTGRVRYECGMSGCTNHELHELEDVSGKEPVTLVVKKQFQTVRAVDTQTGTEKWNFSVGVHEMGMTGLTEGCVQEEDFLRGDEGVLGGVKMLIPEGKIMNEDPANKIAWNKKFSSPIAHTWILEKGRLTYLDPLVNTPVENPLDLYVGQHNQQFYVQESRHLTERLEKLMSRNIRGTIDQKSKVPLIEWKPSLAVVDDREDSSLDHTALTPFATSRPPMHSFFVQAHDEIIKPEEDLDYLNNSSTTPQPVLMHPEEEMEEDSVYLSVLVGTLWVWWKEVLGVSLFTAVLLNIILMRPVMKIVRIRTIREMLQLFREYMRREREQEGQIIPSERRSLLPILPSDSTSVSANDSALSRPRTLSVESYNEGSVEHPEKEIPYMSQYLKEFEPVQCLGKGGFGVVFEAKKKIDDRHYAVKRIALPNRDKARGRVMREVKALAQLDHRNIVRYFNAWIEHPPNGWLEKNDPLWATSYIGSGSPTQEDPHFFPSVGSPSSFSERCHKRKSKKVSKDFDVSCPAVVEEVDDSSYIVFDDNAPLSPNLGNEEESFLTMHKINGAYSGDDLQADTTIDLSDDGDEMSTSFGFWKKPESGAISWDVIPSGDGMWQNSISRKSQCQLKVVNESMNECDPEVDDDIELGEEAQESENVAVMYLYIQQELCQKRTLRDWLRAEKERDVLTIINFFKQIVDAVDYVHSKKLIHRDLKPSNIFLAGDEGQDQIVKIGDFGLATTVLGGDSLTAKGEGEKHGGDDKDAEKDNLTSQVGTHLYMSPEQFKRLPYDYKVDIYSLGLIFFELLIPFQTEMERVSILSVVRKMKPPPSFKDAYPQEHSLIMKMISHTPNERPDATSIGGWVNEHQKALESNEMPKGTHRSNSSPSQMSLYRSDSGSNSSNDNATSWVKGIRNSLSGGKTSNPLLKSHSFSTL